jgi:hypothetical protein
VGNKNSHKATLGKLLPPGNRYLVEASDASSASYVKNSSVATQRAEFYVSLLANWLA